jgi:hypothetical protein
MDAEHLGGFSGRRSFSHETLRKCDLVRGQFPRSSEADDPLFGRRPTRTRPLVVFEEKVSGAKRDRPEPRAEFRDKFLAPFSWPIATIPALAIA